ncbi:hypothetical protein [Halalkalibacter hemicellulosilyticus]|uniref:DUF4352 domain-containing protein n=1 Tax=Halalkalibacter hemicellulosilyticusJCM 9152 TaxID=1236971 RepID=W4QJU7_9BACI|nr:hypothetical protein [Halalkalibacter hemicellulosilyticus]GAE31893.1 hypothetical protein JCM9152_3388 [Halalkalibacter hemicellulosilyticusJCM 9152]
MKKGIFSLLVALLIALLAACGTEEPSNADEPTDDVEVEENGDEEVPEEDLDEDADTEETTSSDNGWDHQVGDVIENDGGSFTLVSRQDEIDTQETGPIVLNVAQVNATSAQIEGDLANFMETDEIEYIQIDFEVENTSEETITFFAGQATITTNTGEQLESDMWLSDHIDGEYIGAVRKSGSQFFILENSKAEDIEWVRILINAPFDDDWNDLGEDLDFTVEF